MVILFYFSFLINNYLKRYFFTVTANYLTGKYESFVYDSATKKLIYSYTRSVTAKNAWDSSFGMRKDTAYIWLGGDQLI